VRNTSESNELEAVLERILDAVMPQSVSLADVKDHLGGYNRNKAKEKIIQAAMREPLLTKIKLHLIYVELMKLANNGGLM